MRAFGGGVWREVEGWRLMMIKLKGSMDGDEDVFYFFDLLPLFLWTAHPLSRPFR